MPDHYDEEAIEGRIILESSAAIKCPSIDLQLVGLKKIEEQMCRDKVWDTVCCSEYTELLPIIKNMYGFDEPEEAKMLVE